MPLLTRFEITHPTYRTAQADTLDWLAEAHAQSEATLARLDDRERAAFAVKIRRILGRVAAAPDKISQRATMIADITSTDWSRASLYALNYSPHGGSTGLRTKIFGAAVDAYFREAYAADTEGPDDLVHVTCTGYLSPSGAQKLVADRGWGARTRVTHAYQMGCYAALPAVRIAAGFAASGARRVDLVHTELCSLHLDPSDHALEQLVVQSLFADGLIRYSLVADESGPGLRPLAAAEVILPGSADSMSWLPTEYGMHMTLARDVPERIAQTLRPFVTELYRRAGYDLSAMPRSMFAVHPGGPKIIDRVREVLELDEAQVAASRRVLFDHGNMSSATLPHIWANLLADPAVPRGTLVPSLAFGPGLTVCGALLEKR